MSGRWPFRLGQSKLVSAQDTIEERWHDEQWSKLYQQHSYLVAREEARRVYGLIHGSATQPSEELLRVVALNQQDQYFSDVESVITETVREAASTWSKSEDPQAKLRDLFERWTAAETSIKRERNTTYNVVMDSHQVTLTLNGHHDQEMTEAVRAAELALAERQRSEEDQSIERILETDEWKSCDSAKLNAILRTLPAKRQRISLQRAMYQLSRTFSEYAACTEVIRQSKDLYLNLTLPAIAEATLSTIELHVPAITKLITKNCEALSKEFEGGEEGFAAELSDYMESNRVNLESVGFNEYDLRFRPYSARYKASEAVRVKVQTEIPSAGDRV